MKRSSIHVFDLDGVITDPKDSSVDNAAVGYIYKLLKDNTYVAVNTGRSYEWVKVNLLSALRDMGGHAHFDHLYIVCEKGGESLIWEAGDFLPQPSRFALSKEAIGKCKQVFESNILEFDTMFWDETKLTMASIEKYPDANLAEFHDQQKVLLEKLKEAFAGRDVKIDGTTIATDVELPGAGKHAGAELIYEWVAQHADANGVSFICFGDSKSDYEMARYFASQGSKTTFVFVGKKEDTFSEHDGVKLVRTNATYSAGTREYLSRLVAEVGEEDDKVT